MSLLYPPTINGLQKTLDAQLDEGATSSMTLNNVTGIQNKAGVVVVRRIDSSGTELDSSLREWIVFTGTSGNTLTGLTRARGGSTDQDHPVGSVVEFVPDVNVFQEILDILDGTEAGARLLTPKIDTSINDTNGNEIIKTPATAAAVNEITVTNAATNDNPTISATGGDTNIDLALKGKGSGRVKAYDGTVSSGVVTQSGQQIYAADAGANDTYVITLAPAPAAYYTGMVVRFKANTINTGAATLNVNSLGAKTIKKNYDSDLANGDIKANQLVEVIYDGTNFQLLSPVSNAASGLSSHAGSFTRDIAGANGNVAYTGVGFVPTALSFVYTTSDAKSQGGGFTDSASNMVSTLNASVAGYIVGDIATNKCIYFSNASGTNQQASLVSYDADGFTLAWTKASTPTGTGNIAYIAFK